MSTQELAVPDQVPAWLAGEGEGKKAWPTCRPLRTLQARDWVAPAGWRETTVHCARARPGAERRASAAMRPGVRRVCRERNIARLLCEDRGLVARETAA